MKLTDVLSFSLGLGLFTIGVHQSILYGIAESYWIFMLSLSLLFLYSYRKGRKLQMDKKEEENKRKKKKGKR